MSKEVKKNKVALSENDIDGVNGGVAQVLYSHKGSEPEEPNEYPKFVSTTLTQSKTATALVASSAEATQQATVQKQGFDAIDGTQQPGPVIKKGVKKAR